MYLFSAALHELDQSQNIEVTPLSCDGHQTWQHGNSLVNFMKLVSDVQFESLSSPHVFSIVSIGRDGWSDGKNKI